jgi:hypothetical protein
MNQAEKNIPALRCFNQELIKPARQFLLVCSAVGLV